MTRYRNKPLAVLDRIYNFIGGLRATSDMDLVSPIVRVHDLSREAELGTLEIIRRLTSGRSPYFAINISNTHGAGTTTEQTQIGVYANQSPSWALATWTPPDPLEETVWILPGGIGATTDGVISNAAQVSNSLQPKASAGEGETPRVTIFAANRSGAVNSAGNFSMEGASGIPPQLVVPQPITDKLLNAVPLEFVSRMTGAGFVEFFVQCMRLPNGVLPPGLR